MKLLSRVWLLATPWTAAHQAPPPVGFSRQEHWSGVPLPSPEGPTLVFNDLINLHKLRYWLYSHKLPILNWYLQPKTLSSRCGYPSGYQYGYLRDISNLIHQNLNLSPTSSRTPPPPYSVLQAKYIGILFGVLFISKFWQLLSER